MTEVTNYVSDELFHSVGFRHPDEHRENYKILKEILAGGWISYWPHAKDGASTALKSTGTLTW